MSAGNEQRKLAAIMFTDMVGYSALAQRDQHVALELLEEHRALLRQIFPKFNGTEIKTIGDAFLVEFQSALEAAQCAIEIQRSLAKRNHDVSSDRRIELKIGIHIGDVVHRGGDVYGDGVNIASRIEALAGAGGICVSMDVERQVRAALEARFEKLAPTELKNISVAMDLFRIVLPWEKDVVPAVQPPRSSKPAKAAAVFMLALVLVVAGLGWWAVNHFGSAKKPAANSPMADAPTVVPFVSQKSIAVLPFADMSEDKKNAFFADGVHEDLLTSLGMLHDLHVVSRTSVEQYRDTTKPMKLIGQELGVAYVLEGSVQREGNKVRVTGQLIRAATDEHVWAKSYDRDLTDIFSIQSELATEIADSLSAVISPQEKTLIDRKPTDNPAAYDLFLKARAFFYGERSDLTVSQARDMLEQAVQRDPNFADAWSLLAVINAFEVFTDVDHTPERLTKAKAAIDTAVRLAPDDPIVIENEGGYYYFGYRDYARAASQYQRLLLLQPGSANAYKMLGFVQRRQGLWAEALANLRLAQQLDPLNINVATELGNLFSALNRYDEAIAEGNRVAKMANGDILLQARPFPYIFNATGSTREHEDWLDHLKPSPADADRVLFMRANVARRQGDWAEVLKLEQSHPYLNPFDTHWDQDVQTVLELASANDLPTARAKAQKLVPQLKTLIESQPANSFLWGDLGLIYAVLGDKDQALQCANKSVALLPESTDAVNGPIASYNLAQVRAWTGDKDGALAELARLLRTPYGANVHQERVDPGWLPLHGDPRFEALLNDPTNNAPIFNDATTAPLP